MAKIIPEYELEIIKIPQANTEHKVYNNYVSARFNMLQIANFTSVIHSVLQVTMSMKSNPELHEILQDKHD